MRQRWDGGGEGGREENGADLYLKTLGRRSECTGEPLRNTGFGESCSVCFSKMFIDTRWGKQHPESRRKAGLEREESQVHPLRTEGRRGEGTPDEKSTDGKDEFDGVHIQWPRILLR